MKILVFLNGNSNENTRPPFERELNIFQNLNTDFPYLSLYKKCYPSFPIKSLCILPSGYIYLSLDMRDVTTGVNFFFLEQLFNQFKPVFH
jgi:hypothetical protein